MISENLELKIIIEVRSEELEKLILEIRNNRESELDKPERLGIKRIVKELSKLVNDLNINL